MMDSRTNRPARTKLFRRTLAAVGVINALLAACMISAGFAALYLSRAGMQHAGEREQFATGMIVGALTWISWLAALVLAALVYGCWRTHRNLLRSGSIRLRDKIMFFSAILPVAMLVAACAAKLIAAS